MAKKCEFEKTYNVTIPKEELENRTANDVANISISKFYAIEYVFFFSTDDRRIRYKFLPFRVPALLLRGTIVRVRHFCSAPFVFPQV